VRRGKKEKTFPAAAATAAAWKTSNKFQVIAH